MNKKVENFLADSLVVLGYTALIGLGIWRVFRHKGAPHAFDDPAKAATRSEPAGQQKTSADQVTPSSSQQQKFESLSLSTPGDAPLDRLAREAAWEEQVNDRPAQSNLKTLDLSEPDDPRTAGDNSVDCLLREQSLSIDRLYGWSVPEPRRLPVPTYAPATMAFGIVVFAMGLATVWYVCVMGSLIFAIAAWRWVAELQGE